MSKKKTETIKKFVLEFTFGINIIYILYTFWLYESEEKPSNSQKQSLSVNSSLSSFKCPQKKICVMLKKNSLSFFLFKNKNKIKKLYYIGKISSGILKISLMLNEVIFETWRPLNGQPLALTFFVCTSCGSVMQLITIVACDSLQYNTKI